MINLREACYAELPSAAQLPARRMCDDPMHCTVFATDADYRRVRLQYLFAGATAKAGPFMWRGRAGTGAMGFLEWANTVTISGPIGGMAADLTASGGVACTRQK